MQVADYREIANNEDIDPDNVMDQEMVKLAFYSIAVKDTPIGSFAKKQLIK